MILTIDPGNEKSAWVLFDEQKETVFQCGKQNNEIVYEKIKSFSSISELCCIEMISSYGRIGSSVLDTCVWIGIFAEAFGRKKVEYFFRKTITTYHTGSPKGNDSTIRSVLISRYGNGNTRIKQTGTILEGITADMWQALAIAIYKSDIMMKRTWHGRSDFVKTEGDKNV